MRVRFSAPWAVLVCAAGVFAAGTAAEFNPVLHRPGAAVAEGQIQRVIVKLRTSSGVSVQSSSGNGEQPVTAAARVTGIAARTALTVRQTLEISPRLQALHVQSAVSGESLEQTLARLRADPDVEYAVADVPRYPHAVPDDPKYSGQWYLQNAQPSAINASGAWDTTVGSTGVVIAELDTGVRFDHPDLLRGGTGGRLLPGYDFVSADPSGKFITSNDGDGWDADPSDPGDWVTSSDASASPFSGCKPGNSSWHGTRVAGMLGALTNNTTGVAGITWRGWILPVRVLGKCGGFNSDVLAGMRWAAGQHVNGVPDNPYPAKILNLSLGSEGLCDSPSADVVSELSSLGVLIVVSAGNEGGPVDSPANCPGAAAVAGLRHAGTKVGFSSLGREVALSAPGGNCVNVSGGPCLYSLDTTANDGTTGPGNSLYTDQFTTNLGTSFSAPIVSGIAGLMLAVNGNLKSAQLIARLKEGATKPFPTASENGPVAACHIPTGPNDLQTSECACTTAVCGAGMANAAGAVAAALRPIAAIAVPAGVSAGQNVALQGGGSAAACGRMVSTYSWAIVNPGANPPGIVNGNTATATVVAPAAGSFTVRLTVTDDAGKTDTADVVVNSSSAITTAPANAGSSACPAAVTMASNPPPVPDPTPAPSGGGGGGGALDTFWLFAGFALAMRQCYGRRQPLPESSPARR